MYSREEVMADIKATEGFEISMVGDEFELLYSEWLLKVGKTRLSGENSVSEAQDRFAEYLHDCLVLDLDVEPYGFDTFFIYGQSGDFSPKWKLIRTVEGHESTDLIRNCLSEENTRLLVLGTETRKRILVEGASSFKSSAI